MFGRILKNCIKYHMPSTVPDAETRCLVSPNPPTGNGRFPTQHSNAKPTKCRSSKLGLQVIEDFPLPLFARSLFQRAQCSSPWAECENPRHRVKLAFPEKPFAFLQFDNLQSRDSQRSAANDDTSSKRWTSIFCEDFPQKLCEEENLIESGGEQKHFEANGVERVKDLRYDGY